MEEDLIRITPNKEKAQSILKMVEITLEMINQIDKVKFPSNVAKEYYEVIRELISIILLLDGFKAIGEGAHKKQIDYLEQNYKEFSKAEITLVDDLRVTRNKIAYDGFFVKEIYIERKIEDIVKIINKLKEIIDKKINKVTSYGGTGGTILSSSSFAGTGGSSSAGGGGAGGGGGGSGAALILTNVNTQPGNSISIGIGAGGAGGGGTGGAGAPGYALIWWDE